jgi:hypothetical protein
MEVLIMSKKGGSNDGLEYFQEISMDGLVDIKVVDDENAFEDEDIISTGKKLYHYSGPVTIYNKVFTRVDNYIHAFSVKQALFLLKEQFVKEHPRTNNASRSWFDQRYIAEEKK